MKNMAILSDYHMHSSFSGDSETPMERMIEQAIKLGLTHICFTEHMDKDFPVTEGEPIIDFEVNVDSYLYELLRCRKKYEKQIRVNFGIELGLQPHLFREHAILTKQHEFDFIIGSSHICNKRDPYYSAFYDGRTEEEAYREYFQSEIDNIKKFSNFDVYGHLDYVVRYGPNKDREYTYEKYKDLLDQIIDLLLEKEKGLEINTGGMKYGLKELHPLTAILKRYRKMGGEIVTIGSDAHTPESIAKGFERAAEMLTECGFKYYTIFENRLPEYKRF